jgi:hypothetical protein
MAVNDFFPPRPAATPTIYAFASTHPDHAGLLKVGNSERDIGCKNCIRPDAKIVDTRQHRGL